MEWQWPDSTALSCSGHAAKSRLSPAPSCTSPQVRYSEHIPLEWTSLNFKKKGINGYEDINEAEKLTFQQWQAILNRPDTSIARSQSYPPQRA
jgi:hypothetical protein